MFQGPSRFLKKLHSHATLLPAGAGYKPHRDPYDAAVILLEGEV